MAKHSHSLSVDLDELVPDFVKLAKTNRSDLLLANVYKALEYISERYQETWMEAASGAALDGLPFVIHSRQYHRTIQRRQVTPSLWEVYTSYATRTGLSVTEILEKGHGLIDLKDGLLRGPKSKIGKKGRYAIVPFRHGTPGSDPHRNNPMPLSVYREFRQQLKQADMQKKAGLSAFGGASKVTRSGGADQRQYSWGTRYNEGDTRGMRSKLISKKGKRIGEYTWRDGKYAGMVAMQASTTKSARSQYMTFRVVSSRSDPMSWIVPEQPPWPVRQAVINFMRPFAEGILAEALAEDIK